MVHNAPAGRKFLLDRRALARWERAVEDHHFVQGPFEVPLSIRHVLPNSAIMCFTEAVAGDMSPILAAAIRHLPSAMVQTCVRECSKRETSGKLATRASTDPGKKKKIARS